MVATKDGTMAVLVNTPAPAIRVAISDERTLVREGLKALLQLQAGLVVATEIGDGADVLSRLTGAPCDVLLLDRGMSLGSTDIRELSESIHVLVLCDDEGDPGDRQRRARRPNERGAAGALGGDGGGGHQNWK